MSHSTLAPFSWHHLNQWNIGFLPLILLIGSSVLYIGATRRVSGWPRQRLLWWCLAILVTFLATQSVIGVYDMAYFSDHMIQHLALIMVAAPLFALAAPLDLAYAAGGERWHTILDSKPMALLTHPLAGFALYFILIPLTHLTGFANAMLEHMWIHELEQIAFLLCGYLFFRVAFGLERGRRLHPGLRLVFVMAAVPVDTFTGLALTMSTTSPLPAYAATAPVGTSSAWQLANIHLGGAIMWIGGDMLMLLACIPITIAWVRSETAATRVLDAELDRLGL